MSEAKAATTLQKKKNTISKGKLKRTIKNVLCRPDPVFWPEITEDEEKRLESALKKHKIIIPEFKKPHWDDLKDIAKEERPKPSKLRKVDGLLLGLKECTEAVQNGECSAIIIEAKVNPRLIVQPIIEMCTAKDIHVLCLSHLRKVSAVNFGIATSCLGIKCNNLLDIKKEIVDIAKNHPKPKQNNQQKNTTNDRVVEKMNVDENEDTKEGEKLSDVPTFEFLYRTNKKSRVFVPTAPEIVLKPVRTFTGQDFIEFSDKPDLKNSKEFMRMLVKKFSNNPDRVKKRKNK